ncbi:MAG TPA: histidine phosphatase family protein [Candidatus Sulfomarinibacteraceae bacterium]|nr:histidine phosphatase family protein [Candidatus Sulfomarinibacteraceae bacterium]
MPDSDELRAPEQRPRLWLVRHGETDWARAGRHTGHSDIPLSDVGRAQAAGLADRLAGLRFSTVLSSPLSRALDTARLAGFGDRAILDPDLREWDYGADEGRTTPEIRAERPGWTIWTHGIRGGEPIAAVSERVDRIIARTRSLDGDTLCFAHGHVLRVLTARWLGLEPSAGALFALGTATISILGWERETPVIARWNDGVDLVHAVGLADDPTAARGERRIRAGYATPIRRRTMPPRAGSEP